MLLHGKSLPNQFDQPILETDWSRIEKDNPNSKWLIRMKDGVLVEKRPKNTKIEIHKITEEKNVQDLHVDAADDESDEEMKDMDEEQDEHNRPRSPLVRLGSTLCKLIRVQLKWHQPVVLRRVGHLLGIGMLSRTHFQRFAEDKKMNPTPLVDVNQSELKAQPWSVHRPVTPSNIPYPSWWADAQCAGFGYLDIVNLPSDLIATLHNLSMSFMFNEMSWPFMASLFLRDELSADESLQLLAKGEDSTGFHAHNTIVMKPNHPDLYYHAATNHEDAFNAVNPDLFDGLLQEFSLVALENQDWFDAAERKREADISAYLRRPCIVQIVINYISV